MNKIVKIADKIEASTYFICRATVDLLLENGSKEQFTYYDFGSLVIDKIPQSSDPEVYGCNIKKFIRGVYPEDGLINEIYFTKEQFDKCCGLYEDYFDGYGECKVCYL